MLVFSPNLSISPVINLCYYDNGTKIDVEQIPNSRESSIRSLGILLDNRFTFKDHVSLVRQKINKSLFFISRIRNTLPLNARKQLYFSYVHSHLIYCLPLLTFLRKTDFDVLIKLQRKAIRIVFNVNHKSDCRPLFHDLGIIPLDKQLEKEILKIMNMVYIYKKPNEISKYFSEYQTEHAFQLRERARFYIPMIKSTKLMKSPIFQFCHIFNQFEGDFKTLSDKKEFERELNLYFFKDIYHEHCKKNFCKICDFDKFEKKIKSYITNTIKCYDFHRFSL